MGFLVDWFSALWECDVVAVLFVIGAACCGGLILGRAAGGNTRIPYPPVVPLTGAGDDLPGDRRASVVDLGPRGIGERRRHQVPAVLRIGTEHGASRAELGIRLERRRAEIDLVRGAASRLR